MVAAAVVVAARKARFAPIHVREPASEGDAAMPGRARETDVAQTGARSVRSGQGARREGPRDANRSRGIPWRGCATALLLVVAACARPPAAVESTPEPASPSPVAQLAASEAPATPPPAPSLPPKPEAPAEPTAPSRPTPTPTATLAPMPRIVDVGFPGQGGSFTMAYTDEAGLWAYDGTEAPRLLLEAPDLREVSLSEDGAWVAVRQWHRELLRDGDRERVRAYPRRLLVARVADGSLVVDVDPVQLNSGQARQDEDGSAPCGIERVHWIPSRDAILFSTERDCLEETGFGILPRDDLWLVEPSGASPRQLLTPGQALSFAPSPDGTRIAHVTFDAEARGRTLKLSAIDGGPATTLLTFPGLVTESEWTAFEEPYWTPDGERVILGAFAEVESGPFAGSFASMVGEPADVHILPRSGEPLRVVEAPSEVLWVHAGLGGEMGLHISPDRTRLSMMRPATNAAPTAESPDAYPPPRPLAEIVVLDLDAPDPITQTARVEIPAAPSLRNHGWSRLGCRSGLLAGAGEGRSLFKPYDADADADAAAPWLVQASADAWPRDLDCRHVARLRGERLIVEPLDRLLAETDEAREAVGPALLLAEGVRGLDVVTAVDPAVDGGAQEDVTEGEPDS